jgi:hypothetical protein
LSEVLASFPWARLEQAGLWGTAVVIRRSEIAFLKHVVESYEGLGFTRMVASEGESDAVVAVMGPASSRASLEELLLSLRGRAGYPLAPRQLPAICHESWFCAEWD